MENDQLANLCKWLYDAGVESAKRKGARTQDLDDYGLGFTTHMLTKIGIDVLLVRLSEPGEDAWLGRCADNYVIDLLRRQSRETDHKQEDFLQPGKEEEDDSINNLSDDEPSPEILALRHEFLDELRELPGLTEKQRAILIGYFLFDENKEALAASLGTTVHAIEQQISNLRKRLPKLLIKLLEQEDLTKEDILRLFFPPRSD